MSGPVPAVTLVDGIPRVSSLDIAEKFGKRHDHVMRSIKDLMDNCPKEFTAPNFGVSEYTDKTGRKLPLYHLTRDAFTLVTMGFTGQAALVWKLRYIEAFNAMEAELGKRAKPHPLPNGWRDRPGAKPRETSEERQRRLRREEEHCTRGQAKRLEAAVDLWCELCGIRRMDALSAIRVRFDLRIFDRPPLRLHVEILNWISQQSGGRVPAPRDPSFNTTVRPKPKPQRPKAPADAIPLAAPEPRQVCGLRLAAPALRPLENLNDLEHSAEDCQRRLGIHAHALAGCSGEMARHTAAGPHVGSRTLVQDAIRDNLNAAHAAAQTALSLLKGIRNLCHAAQ